MREGEHTHLPQIKGGLSQADVADLLNVGVATVERAKKVQRDAAPEVVQAVDAGELTITAALPFTDLPKHDQAAILAEVREHVHGKRPTTTQTRAAVSQVHVRAPVKEQLAAGHTPQEAVQHGLQKHEITLPTPALADAICQATNRQVTLAATDGVYHDGRTKEEEAAAMA